MLLAKNTCTNIQAHVYQHLTFVGTGAFANGINNASTGANMIGGDGTGDNVDSDNVLEERGIGGNITGRDTVHAG